MNLLEAKLARTGLWYVVLCALALAVSQRAQLGLVTDGRDGALRELMLSPAPADVLCLGSSATARAIMPAVVEQRGFELSGERWRVLNLAPFGAGRHIGFLQLERWLETHPAPATVVVEVSVSADLVEYMHQMLPRFMGPVDAARGVLRQPYRYRDAREQGRRLRSPPHFDPWGMFTRLDRFAMHLELALEALGRGPEDVLRFAFNRAVTGGESSYFRPRDGRLAQAIAAQVAEGGFYRVPPDSEEAVNGKALVAAQAARVDYERALAASWDLREETDVFADRERFRPARTYAEELARIAGRHGVRLVFLDVPNFRGKPLRPSQVEFYSSLGELLSLDRSVLYREECFQDPGHLSPIGAEHASRQLAEFLAGVGAK